MNLKKSIKGVTKTIRKYTLKGIGRNTELIESGTSKTVNALVKNPSAQKIVTSAGTLTAEVMIPSVGTRLISVERLKYMKDRALLKKGLINEIVDIISAGNIVTKSASKVLSRTFEKADEGIKNIGQKGQDKIEDLLR